MYLSYYVFYQFEKQRKDSLYHRDPAISHNWYYALSDNDRQTYSNSARRTTNSIKKH